MSNTLRSGALALILAATAFASDVDLLRRKTVSASSVFDGNWSPWRLVDDNLDTGFHSLVGDSNAWVQVDLGSDAGQRAPIGIVTVNNRAGCANRLFHVTAGHVCTSAYGEYSGANEGAWVGVSDTPCSGEVCDTANACGKITTFSASTTLTIDCGGKTGRYVYLMTPGSSRTINVMGMKAYSSLPQASGVPHPADIHAVYDADSFDGSTWRDSSGRMPNAVIGGTVTRGSDDRVGNFVRGSTSATVLFQDSVPVSFTLCSLTRYDGPMKKRILQGLSSNWLHGHWGGRPGSVYYGGWKTRSYDEKDSWHSYFDDKNIWTVTCAENHNSGVSVWINHGFTYSYTGGGTSSPNSITINRGNHAGESSDWAVSDIIVYDGHLSAAEVEDVSSYLLEKMGSTVALGHEDTLPLSEAGGDFVTIQSSAGNNGATASCPAGYGITDCSCRAADPNAPGCYGSEASYDLTSCTVMGSGSMFAEASCARNLGGGARGVVIHGPVALANDDSKSSVTCPVGWTLFGCSGSAHSTSGGLQDGAYYQGGSCVSHSSGRSGGYGRPIATCYKNLDAVAKTNFKNTGWQSVALGATVSASCSAGEVLTHCQCYSLWTRCAGAWIDRNQNKCFVQQSSVNQVVGLGIAASYGCAVPTTNAPTSAPTTAPTTAEYAAAVTATNALGGTGWTTGRQGDTVYKCDSEEGLCFSNDAADRSVWNLESSTPAPTDEAIGHHLEHVTSDGTFSVHLMGMDFAGTPDANGDKNGFKFVFPWQCGC